MTETTRASLRQLLVDRYDELRNRLARRLGSTELAGDTLQATYLRLDRTGDVGFVRSPEAYLLRIALNVAADQRQAEKRQLSLSEIEMLRHLDDDELDPERVTGARSEMAALVRALDELPTRRRAIFIAARVEGLPHAVLAQRFGISVRMVERELKRALEHCGARLERNSTTRFGSRPS